MSGSQREPAARRAPPYAKQLPTRGTVLVSAGPDAWERARRWAEDGRPGLVLPADAAPGDFQWPVRGRHVAVIATDMHPKRVEALARTLLLRDGARMLVVLWGPAHEPITEVFRGRHV